MDIELLLHVDLASPIVCGGGQRQIQDYCCSSRRTAVALAVTVAVAVALAVTVAAAVAVVIK